MTRILHVNKFLYRRGGAEGYMFDLAEMQAAAGDSVEFFGMTFPDNDPMRFAAYFPSQVDFDPAPATAAGKVAGLGRMLWSPSASRGMAHVLDEFRPDVVHFHNIYHQLSPSILQPLKRRGVPSVMTLHDYQLACPTHNFMSHGEICESCMGGHFSQAVRKRCQNGSVLASLAGAAELTLHTRLHSYRPIDVLICPSRFMLRKMTEAGVYPEKLRLLNHFVTVEEPPKPTVGADFVFAGRLAYEKGVDILIRAMGSVPEDAGHLHVLGEGPDREELGRLAAEVAPGRVTFHGRVTRAVVVERLRAAALSVVPSRWYENQPLSILESFTAGTAVVASDLGGIPELVRDGATGATFAPSSVEGLARVLTDLGRDPQRCHALGLAARSWVETEFSPERHLEGVRAFYAEAMNQVPQPQA
ncbi:MAG: hypothetical protein QOK15_220 [Nocardioidaceae bacterium]|jgi:glycosyltransferase involved in cell wall biosynthesis|nr:hypothetical protein [Nocardioidaceae bacterium]